MWPSGNCQPGTQLDTASVLSQRKRSIDLVRQAQFAACSYLGFDPYEEKHRNGIGPQSPASEPTGPLELHLHHHHHHHYRDNTEILKRGTHMPANTDSTLGVGGILSICDHIQLLQDAWQGHGKLDDQRSERRMGNGSLIKREAGVGGLEGGMSSQSDKKERARERNSPYVEHYWNGTSAGISPPVSASDNQHFNTAARISHWECSVIQEENLTKGFGMESGLPDRSRTMSLNTESPEFMTTSKFGWGPTAKYSSSTHFTPTRSNAKTERRAAGDLNTLGSNQDLFAGPTRKFGSAVSKRKKSSVDEDLCDDQSHSNSSDMMSQTCLDSSYTNHVGQLENTFESAKKLLGSSNMNFNPSLRSSVRHGCDLQAPEKGMPTLHVGKSVCSVRNTDPSSCEEYGCQQSVPLHTSSSCHGNQEVSSLQMTGNLIKDPKGHLGLVNTGVKQDFLNEKIISLDAIGERDSFSTCDMANTQEKTLLVKHDQDAARKNAHAREATSMKSYCLKITEDCVRTPVKGNSASDDDRMNRVEQVNTDAGVNKCLNVNIRNEHITSDSGGSVDEGQKGQTVRTFHDTGTRQNVVFHDNIFQGGSSTQKGEERIKTMQDVGVQIQIKDEDLTDWSSDLDLRLDRPRPPEKLEKVEMIHENKVVNHLDSSAAEVPIQVGDNDCLSPGIKVSKTAVISKESLKEGITGSSRIQQQLDLEKSRHESSKKELEQVKKDYEEFLRELGTNKDMQHLSVERDSLSKTLSLMQEKERKRLTSEIEARLAAEEKAQIFEASAEAAESRLLRLLDERTKLHLKFDEELNQKEADRFKLQSLFEKEKLKSEATEKELLEVKEKFAVLMNKAPLSPKCLREAFCETLLSTKSTSDAVNERTDVLEKYEIFEKREEKVGLSRGKYLEFSKVRRSFDRIQDIKLSVPERSLILKDKETDLLQQVRQQELQLKTAEDAFEELERRLKQVEVDKFTPKYSIDSSKVHKDLKGVEKATQTNSWVGGVYEKYSCVYESPIFEHGQVAKGNYKKLHHEKPADQDTDDRSISSKEPSEDQTDIEIRQLTEELKSIGADMRVQKLHQSSRDNQTEQFFSGGVGDSSCLKNSPDVASKDIAKQDITYKALRQKLKDQNLAFNEIVAQHAKELQRVENLSGQAHQMNKELASNLAAAEARLQELQVHYDGLLASLEKQLNEARSDVEALRKNADELHHNLSRSENRVEEFKKSAEQKEVQLKEMKKTIKDLHIKKDAAEKVKIEVSLKLQEARKEADEQKLRAAEYLSINEELLEFAQGKENEVVALSQQVQNLQQQILEKTNETAKLQADLGIKSKDLIEVQKTYNSLESEHELLKAKLTENNIQLVQHEGTIGTLTKQMADIMEGRDSMLEEAAQFHGYLQNAKYKEFELENELRQSTSVIKDLEEKLQNMESEMSTTALELADMKKQNNLMKKLAEDKGQEALGTRKAMDDLRKKIQDLEEEVMEKEGQIAILRGSFPGEFESTF